MGEQKVKRINPLVNTQEEYYIRPRAADKKMKAAQTMSQTEYYGKANGIKLPAQSSEINC